MLDLTPSLHVRTPHVADEIRMDRGPVLLTVTYRIHPARAAEFRAAMLAMRRVRRRDGAYRWGLFEDVAQPGRYLETFVVESWAEHLRQHERGTTADRTLQEQAYAFHVGDGPPPVEHLIWAYDSAA